MFEKQEKVDFLDKVIIKRTNRKKTISISIRNDTVTLLSPKLIKYGTNFGEIYWS